MQDLESDYISSDSEENSTATVIGFLYKWLLKVYHVMWQIAAFPVKATETLGSLYRYAFHTVDHILCTAGGKARRKERDGDQNSTDTKLYLEESVLERKLPEADLKALVDLPAGLDYNEWLASHTLALFDHVNLVYGTISEFCTPTGCTDMTGPGNKTYLWFDEKGKKTRVAAPQYIDYVMTFTQKTVSDETIFPTKYANEFPSSFESIARKILRLQFHVIAHLYATHFREIALLGLHTHLNLTFAHLTALHRRFNLIDEKETDVLRDLEVALRLTDDTNHCSATDTNSNSSTATTTTTTTTTLNNSSTQITAITVDTNFPIKSSATTAAAATATSSSSATGDDLSSQQHLNNNSNTHHAILTTATTTTTTTLIDAGGNAVEGATNTATIFPQMGDTNNHQIQTGLVPCKGSDLINNELINSPLNSNCNTSGGGGGGGGGSGNHSPINTVDMMTTRNLGDFSSTNYCNGTTGNDGAGDAGFYQNSPHPKYNNSHNMMNSQQHTKSSNSSTTNIVAVGNNNNNNNNSNNLIHNNVNHINNINSKGNTNNSNNNNNNNNQNSAIHGQQQQQQQQLTNTVGSNQVQYPVFSHTQPQQQPQQQLQQQQYNFHLNHPKHFMPNSGLIQCNVGNVAATSSSTVSTSTTTA